MKISLLLLFLLERASTTASAKIYVDWFIPEEDSLPSSSATVGDTVTFYWEGYHDVQLHPSGNCGDEGAILIGGPEDLDGVDYKFGAGDVGEVTFACDISLHCESGQIITFTVNNSTDQEINDSPMGTPSSGALVGYYGAAAFPFFIGTFMFLFT